MISGLPRSGSTLLSSILNQNPKFSAGIDNPLNHVLLASIRAFSTEEFFTESIEVKRINVLRGIVKSFYEDDMHDVVFNSSRLWTGSLPLINLLYPDAKIICCVRDIGWILDSLEKLYNENPTVFSKGFYGSLENTLHTDVFLRADNFMGDTGFLMRAIRSLQTAYFSEYNNKMMLIEYDDLVQNPKETLRKLYHFIDEPWFDHDFNNTEASYEDFDRGIGVKNLHKVRNKVEFINRNTIIPPMIWQKYSGMEFWRN